MMKKLTIALFALLPLSLWAQDNSWENEDDNDVATEAVKTSKQKVDAKYLKGAVPVVDGHVVFSKTIEAPGKTADQIYDILLKYMERLTKTSNQLNSQLAISDKSKHELAGSYEEWLVFKKSALTLDRTRLYYILHAQCSDGKAVVTMKRIHYLYEEERNPERYKAEEWITDKEAVNKKNTNLQPMSGKFRRKTIDRKDYLFNKLESLLK